MKLLNSKINHCKVVLAALPRSAKGKSILIAAVAAVVITASYLHADSGGNQSEHNTLAGSWIKENGVGGLTPLLTTFNSDGSLTSSRCIIVPTGPASVELVSSGHGQWIRTGHNAFMATRYFLRSGPATEFTGLVKLTETLTLNDASDQITSTGTLSIYDADNNLLFPPSTGSATVARRINAGE